jgi:geranylgeranyl diphosphate synthase, type II
MTKPSTEPGVVAGPGIWMDGCRERADAALRSLCDSDELGRADARLREAMRYSLLAGGKRLRPVLVYAAAEALGGSTGNRDDTDRLACAIECIHTYSLIHDDLPAMDNDDLRRGMPTCHRAFDEATAILAGDALQTLGFELLCNAQSFAAPVRLQLLRTLAAASGSDGMVGGQAIDLAHVGRLIDPARLETMHALKTGALIRAALRMGGLAAGAGDAALAHLDRFATHIGLAFQVRDDILDACGDASALGKNPGSDAAQNKPTYVTTLGLDGARALAAQLLERAIDSLQPLGTAATVLAELARFVVQRNH